MQYQKITSGETIIEFHNSWLGEETVIVNGQVVSKKSSVWGTNHYFTVMEHGHQVRYILTTRINELAQVVLDLSKNGSIIHENLPVRFGTKPRKPKNKAKQNGLSLLKEYDLEDALVEFEKALELDPKDPEIHFHMACAFSNLERTKDAFEFIKLAVEYGLQDREIFLTHEMLAFVRIHPAFEGFLNSDFKEYDSKGMEKPDDDLLV